MINLLNKKQKQPHQKRRAFSLIELSIVIIIIGLIIAGITGAKSLINQSKLSAARMLTQSSAALGSEDMVVWLDATSKEAYIDGEGIIDGSSLSKVKDTNAQIAEGDRSDAEQSDVAKQPSYLKEGINNLPAIYFDAVGEELVATLSRPVLEDGYTLFVVHQSDEEIGGGNLFNLMHNYTNSGINFYSHSTIGAYAMSASGGGGAAVSVKSNQPILIRLTYDQQPFLSYKIQGSLKHYTTNEPMSVKSGTLNFSAIENHTNSYDTLKLTRPSHNSKIGEVILYNRTLSDTEIERIEKYLIEKWEIDT